MCEPALEKETVYSLSKAGGGRSHSLLAALSKHKVLMCSEKITSLCDKLLAHQRACFSALLSRQQRQALLHTSNYNTKGKLSVAYVTLKSRGNSL